MSIFNSPLIGLEIQEKQIIIVAGRSSGRSVVTAWEKIRLDTTLPLEDRLKDAVGVIGQFVKKYGGAEPVIAATIPDKEVITQTVVYPGVVLQNLHRTMEYEIEKYIPFKKDDIYYDVAVNDKQKKKEKIEVLIAAVKKEKLEVYLTILTGTGPMVSMTPRIISLLWALGLKNKGVVVFIDTLQITCIRHDGEHCQDLCTIARGSGQEYAELAGFIEKMAKKHKLQRKDILRLCVDQSVEAELETVLEKYTAGDCHPPDCLEKAELLPAYGAALLSGSGGYKTINLLPDNCRKKPDNRAKYLMFALTGSALLVGIGIMGTYLYKQDLYNQQITAAIQRLGREVSDLPDIEREVKETRKRIEFLTRFAKQKNRYLPIILELSRIIPTNCWINRLSIDGETIRLDGKGKNVADLIGVLEDSPYLEDVQFISTVRRDAEGSEIFSMEMKAQFYP